MRYAIYYTAHYTSYNALCNTLFTTHYLYTLNQHSTLPCNTTQYHTIHGNLTKHLWIRAENQHWRGLDCANGGSSSSSRVHIEDSCLLLLLLAQIRSQMTNRLAVLIVQCHKKMRRVIFDLTPEAHSVTESPFFVFGVFTVFVFGIFFSKNI